MRPFDLADLLTASGVAVASANERLVGAPALLKQMETEVRFPGIFRVRPGAASLQLTRLALPLQQAVLAQGTVRETALTQFLVPTVAIRAVFIAAPALPPATPAPAPAGRDGAAGKPAAPSGAPAAPAEGGGSR